MFVAALVGHNRLTLSSFLVFHFLLQTMGNFVALFDEMGESEAPIQSLKHQRTTRRWSRSNCSLGLTFTQESLISCETVRVRIHLNNEQELRNQSSARLIQLFVVTTLIEEVRTRLVVSTENNWFCVSRDFRC